MHKTITVTIGGSLFVIEEQAYKRLEAYLASVRAHFATFPEHEEIVSDIEDRIAEEFGEKLNARKKTINEKDVEELVKNMGTVEDFQRFDAEEPRAAAGSDEPQGRKGGKLYRSSDDQVIGGVCAGLASFFGVEAVWVRVGFAVLGLLNGIGILIYIVLWAIVPEAKTASEKVEMSQGAVTLTAIQQKIEETLPKEKRDGFIRNVGNAVAAAVRGVVKGVGGVIGFVVPLVGRVVGTFMAIGASLAVAFLLFVTIAVLANPNSPYIGIPIHDILGGPLLYVLAASGFMLAFVPLLFAIILGTSLMTMRSAFTGPATVAMLTLWLMAGVATGVTLFSAGPNIEAAFERLEEEHSRTMTSTVDVGAFQSVLSTDNIRMNVRQGREHRVTLTVPEKDTESIVFANADGRLIPRRKNVSDDCILFCPDWWTETVVDVTMPSLVSAEADGVSRLTVNGFTGGTIALKAGGNSRIEANVAPDVANVDADGISRIVLNGGADTLNAILTGNSRLEAPVLDASGVTIRLDGISRATLIGTGRTLDATLLGNSRLEAEYFAVTDADVKVDGISRAIVYVTGKLKGFARGHSRVQYRGEPASVDADVETNGLSRVEPLEDDETRALQDRGQWREGEEY